MEAIIQSGPWMLIIACIVISIASFIGLIWWAKGMIDAECKLSAECVARNFKEIE